jgi:chromate reductase, NAD(P)H dehydrogenase (quinone)
MDILLMAASAKTDSCNKKLINVVAKICEQQKIATKKLDFIDFLVPPYNGDVEEKSGLPEIVQTFISQLKNSNGLIISSPEYNFSTPGTLKNLIDWVSRAKPMPWSSYPVMLCSASPAMVGGNRGLLHTASVLEFCCNAYVFPSMFSLANAYEAFAGDGSLKDKSLEQKLMKNITAFMDYIKNLQN